jgi:hypothetical protein
VWSLKDSLSGKVDAFVRQCLETVEKIEAALRRRSILIFCTFLSILDLLDLEGFLEQGDDVDQTW